jgi:hypothetical protein
VEKKYKLDDKPRKQERTNKKYKCKFKGIPDDDSDPDTQMTANITNSLKLANNVNDPSLFIDEAKSIKPLR